MLGIHGYLLFVAAGVLLNLTPGQDTMFIIGRSLSGGQRSGVAAAFGIAVGSIGHTLAAALGLSVILATSAAAFTVVKFAGAAYLIYLGARLLLSKHAAAVPAAATAPAPATAPASASASASATPPGAAPRAPSSGARAAFGQGILTNLLNPKVALFFLAFLPQFIDSTSPTRTLAFLLLGATFVTTGLAWCLVLAVAAGRLQAFFLRNPNMRVLLDRAVGALFLALGARLAWAR
jgi:threonine/homoserine/homoserine lactone efflux protein